MTDILNGTHVASLIQQTAFEAIALSYQTVQLHPLTASVC